MHLEHYPILQLNTTMFTYANKTDNNENNNNNNNNNNNSNGYSPGK